MASRAAIDVGSNPPNARNVFALAWPMTIKAILLHGIFVIDAYLVSGLGETALAAMGLAGAIAGIVLSAIHAFSGGMQIRTAQAFGTQDDAFLKSTLAAGLTISLIVGSVGLALISLFGGTIINWLAPTPEVATLARGYLAVFSLVILAEAIGQILSSYLNGCGRTRIPLYSFCLSLPLNVTASAILIWGMFGLPAFGVTGAAMGSAIAVTVQVGFLIYQVVKTDRYLTRVAGWRGGRFASALNRHFVFALPIAMTFFSAGLAGHICNLMYAKMTLNAFAAMTLIAPWIMVTGQISMQWTQATGIIVAQLLGAKTEEATLDRFLSAAWRGAFVTAVIGTMIFVVICLSADRLYTDLTQETRGYVLGFLPVLLVLSFPKATNAICGNTLRASGDTIYVMKLFLASQWLFRVPATAIAVLYFNISPVWILCLLLCEELLKFFPFHLRLRTGDWKRSEIAA